MAWVLHEPEAAALLARRAVAATVRAFVAEGGELRGARVLPLAEIAALMNYRQHTLPPGADADPTVSVHAVMKQPFLLANGVQGSLVEVDIDSGLVRLLKHWVVEDCGRVINPLLADEQLRGGVFFGKGGIEPHATKRTERVRFLRRRGYRLSSSPMCSSPLP